MDKPSIGFIGVGMVGGALSRWFKARGHETFLFDLHKEVGSENEVNRADVVFVAVPTPFDEAAGRFDGSAVESALRSLGGSKTVIIKSTVLPGMTDSLQEIHPEHRLIFSPEFLTESTADHDVSHPMMNILGYTASSKDAASEIMRLLARAPFERIMPAAEAEFFKYLRNTFFSTKVIFFNQMYDLCEKLGLDYDAIRECAAADPWVGGQHTTVWHKGYRGYGGKCLPKDTRALMQFSRERGAPPELLETVERVNNALNELRPNSEVAIALDAASQPDLV